jgi:hypothetical protein
MPRLYAGEIVQKQYGAGVVLLTRVIAIGQPAIEDLLDVGKVS